jgi:hypothetical protein
MLQFTAAMFSSLAWPVVVVIVAVLVRPELSGLLRRVASVEVPGAKMTFDGLADFRKMEKISEAAVKNVRPEDERAIVRSEETEFSPLKKMATTAPRDAIIDAWNLLEYQLDVAADRIAPGQPHGWPQVAPTLQAWGEWASLSPVVAELSRLRDFTARTAQPPLSSDAVRYVAVVEDLVTTLRASFKRGFDTGSGDDV